MYKRLIIKKINKMSHLGFMPRNIFNELAPLPAVTSLVGTELIPIEQGTANKSITPDMLYDSLDTGIPTLEIMNALGSPAKILSPGMLYSSNSNFTMADTNCYFYSFYVRKTTSITSVSMMMHTQGVYTADNYNGVGIYSVSGGTLTLIDSSVNDGNIWKAVSATTITKTFSTGTITLTPGVYFLAILYNSSAQTTAPILYGGPTNASLVVGFTLTNSNCLNAYKSAQSTLPASLLASTYSYGTSSVLSFILY